MNMQVVTTIAEVREKVKEWRVAGRKVGFVPTMGNLHEGHLALCRLARKVTRHLVVSTFESPMSFGPNEDFDHQPRTPERDEQLLKSVNCDLLYRPDPREIFPHGLLNAVHIEVPGYTDILCGALRPGHFEALVSVANRLFNVVQPDIAVLGEKDFQQLVVIRRMVEELKMPINIVAAPTVRTPDGLAMSSRNQNLSDDERRLAPRIYEELRRSLRPSRWVRDRCPRSCSWSRSLARYCATTVSMSITSRSSAYTRCASRVFPRVISS